MLSGAEMDVVAQSSQPGAALCLAIVYQIVISMVLLNILMGVMMNAVAQIEEDQNVLHYCSKAAVTDEVESTLPPFMVCLVMGWNGGGSLRLYACCVCEKFTPCTHRNDYWVAGTRPLCTCSRYATLCDVQRVLYICTMTVATPPPFTISQVDKDANSNIELILGEDDVAAVEEPVEEDSDSGGSENGGTKDMAEVLIQLAKIQEQLAALSTAR